MLEGVFPQFAFQEFSLGRSGEILNKDDFPGGLVGCHPLLAELDKIRFYDLTPGLQLDKGGHGLPVFFMGKSRHSAFLHGIMAIEYILDFSWIDIQPSADDHVFDTIYYVKITLRIDAAHIAGMEPAACHGPGGFRGTVIIPFHNNEAPGAGHAK